MSLLVVMPTRGMREDLPGRVEGLLDLPPAPDLLLVERASSEGTARLADELAELLGGRLHVIHCQGRAGIGSDCREAMRWALERDYTRVCQMDADFSHGPKDVLRLLEAVEDGADLALGSRYVPGGVTRHWGLKRRLISRFGNGYARVVLGVPIRDLTSGFKVFRREVLETLPLDHVLSEGYAFQIEMTYRTLSAGFRVIEVPILFEDRRVGRSKTSWGIVREAVFRVPQLRILSRRW